MSLKVIESGTRLAPPIKGGPREIGQALGALGREAWQAHIAQSPVWAELQLWRQSPRLQRLAALTQTRFPVYWEELLGLAEGLDTSADDAFLWNCRGDLQHKTRDGCTSVAIPGGATTWMGHNEDGDPFFAPSWCIVDIQPKNAPGFVSFYYPGSLPGHTFAVNNAGLVQTINNLRTTTTCDGIPRMILSRAVLDAQRIDDAISILHDFPRAGGFHHLLAQAGHPYIVSIEAMPEICSIETITRNYGHANHAIHAATGATAQIITQSSNDRQLRIAALADTLTPDAAVDGIRRVLADKGSAGLPILRDSPDDPDHENTLATGVFEIAANKISFDVIDGGLKRAASFVIKIDVSAPK